ncbi:hypothetical protein YC2023_089174 [Brassica napus]
MSRISCSTIVRRCLRLIRQTFCKHNIFGSTTFQKLDIFEDRHFFITKFSRKIFVSLEAGRELRRMGIKQDGIEARRENPKLGENPNFGIMEFFEEAGSSGNIFTGYQNSSGLSVYRSSRCRRAWKQYMQPDM